MVAKNTDTNALDKVFIKKSFIRNSAIWYANQITKPLLINSIITEPTSTEYAGKPSFISA